jgi:hypothetical protein
LPTQARSEFLSDELGNVIDNSREAHLSRQSRKSFGGPSGQIWHQMIFPSLPHPLSTEWFESSQQRFSEVVIAFAAGTENPGLYLARVLGNRRIITRQSNVYKCM